MRKSVAFLMILAIAGMALAQQPEASDIVPFALPNTPPGEIRFEEPRDIKGVLVEYENPAPQNAKLFYLRQKWPEVRIEEWLKESVIRLGWMQQDDLFNGVWRPAAIDVARRDEHHLWISFRGLATELPKFANYDVAFRRTLGLRLETQSSAPIRKISVFTTSAPARTRLHVELDAGRPTPGSAIQLSAYNAAINRIDAPRGARVKKQAVTFAEGVPRAFDLTVDHLAPAHDTSGDDGLVTIGFGEEAVTISLPSLEREGPVWSEDFGIFVTGASRPMTLAAYRARQAGAQTIAQQVRAHAEQSLAGAMQGQPRPHPVGTTFGCTHSRQRFWIEPNGEILLHKKNVAWMPGRDTALFKSKGNARFLFGLENWNIFAQYVQPVLVHNLRARRGNLELEQQAFAVPLLASMRNGSWRGDDPMVALVRFRLHNTGNAVEQALLPLTFTQDPAGRMGSGPDNFAQRRYPLDPLKIDGNRVLSDFKNQPVLRASFQTAMTPEVKGNAVQWRRSLKPGASCELVLKIPYIALSEDRELHALESLKFEACLSDMTAYWNEHLAQGEQIVTPEPILDRLHAAHLAHVQVTDIAMPGDPGLVNTSVGSSSYGNFTNESCMIVHDLEQRGLSEEARRRLAVWLKYQGTAKQSGNFTDFRGMFFGAGGFEQGEYNQHHGWALWAMGEHYFLTRDEPWLRGAADKLIAGADWVFRQRRNTMTALPHSRGWEFGFLPAGSLEDVRDYFYWLTTNAFTWRGVDSITRALEAIHHPEASRLRREADAYRADVIKGFETARRMAPLVRLRDGRWIPAYPSRLYRRGRELGWIRETLEGSVNLLIAGLYDPASREAGWILDDFQDNRYSRPPYGYTIPDFETNWFDCAGISMQPNLLAGLLPYLDRDEPEIYIWMFYNAWNSCYRPELGAMTEHPMPVLGYSNGVQFKTSDEANATSWLRYLFVYAPAGQLYLGRAIPRAWFAQAEPFEARDVATPFGKVSVRYEPAADQNKIVALARLDLARDPGQIQLRIRHPDRRPIRTLLVDGRPWTKMDRDRGDIDLTGLKGDLRIEAQY